MTYEEIYTKYKPKEGYEIHRIHSTQTGKYVAVVFKKMEVNRFKKEHASGSVACITELSIDKYFELLKPYLDERVSVDGAIAHREV